ncbi:YCII-related domain protein [Aquisphaera giovannonii]|uniref:YCII-related domain protein n=1 Tax=Aquisphaera giovannonii TaxID=406548 RepID=A0A5B9VWI2_9BACT|nr:YciI family protein [Aquisphaera giovannonii]QEH32743.1 YCII-related domain protein [Aquisphaera giovannonii]
MKVMVIVRATADSESGALPGERILREMGEFNEQLAKAGVLLAGEGLKPSSQGVRVRFSGKDRTVIDGPFAETKELIAGFWIWKVASLQEAIDWARRCPNPFDVESDLEIRPMYEPDDFAPSDPTGEVREQERRLRDEAAARAGGAS